jgi:[protein-PII] uridylyltransferase
VTEITVYAVDQPGLFSQIAGAMAVGGANIMDARIFTLANGLALDTFWVQDAAGGPFDRPDRIARLTTYITRAAEVRLNVHDELAKRPAPPSRTRVFTVAPRVVINNGASAGHTIIEVNARDRVGLLYDVTDAITGLGLQISSAHVTTFGERAVDVFYVKNAFGLKVENEVRLNEIREVLLAALENEAGPDSVKRKKRPAKRFGQPKPKAAPRAKSRKRTAGTGGRRKPKPAAAQ